VAQNQQARQALTALRQSIERINMAKHDPSQLDQVVQEVQQQLKQLEQQLNAN
jgi:tRNA C32,U32 (ribose-2'-O)-methylase TrmJ